MPNTGSYYTVTHLYLTSGLGLGCGPSIGLSVELLSLSHPPQHKPNPIMVQYKEDRFNSNCAKLPN